MFNYPLQKKIYSQSKNPGTKKNNFFFCSRCLRIMGIQFIALLKPLVHLRAPYRTEGFKGALNCSPIMPRGASLPDSGCESFQFGLHSLRLALTGHLNPGQLAPFRRCHGEDSFCHPRLKPAEMCTFTRTSGTGLIFKKTFKFKIDF